MTNPADVTQVALQYVREELATLRDTTHVELSKISGEIGSLAREMRTYMTEQGPRMAVLETRVADQGKDIEGIRSERAADKAEAVALRERDRAEVREAKRESWRVWLALVLAVVGPVLTWVLPPLFH